MIQLTRTSSVAPGKFAEGLAFAREMTEYLRGKYDFNGQVAVPVGGNPHRISWRSTHPSLAALEDFQGKTMQDPKYLAILSKAADIFIPGSAYDEIWRVL